MGGIGMMNIPTGTTEIATSQQASGGGASRREALNESRVWHVYARRQYDEPLHEIGNVVADDEEMAKVYASSIYDEFAWIEMILVPRDSIVTIIAS
jgi:1,2-phenylacetyl-CoA epoxidase PaaB subunit